MAKKLIVCADGTWNTQNESDQGRPCATNVFKVARALLPHYTDPQSGQITPQVVYYITGVGTAFGQRVSGGAFGVGLFANVLDCYLQPRRLHRAQSGGNDSQFWHPPPRT